MKNEFTHDYKSLGLNIAFYRKRSGLSQSKLAELVGVSAERI